jgi:4-amino-4-deoxy-L-arabinose transferase-like glycosyltransferase
MNPPSKGKAYWLVFGLALCLRLFFWGRLAAEPQAAILTDTPSYTAPADSLLKEGRFLGMDGAPDSQRTPGYPVFLALHRLFSSSPRWPGLTQCLLDSLTAVLAAAAAVGLTAHPWAWVAGLLYALDPVAAAHAPLLITEPLFSFLLMLCAWRLARAQGAAAIVAAGTALGLAALTRPVAVYLWLPWSLALLAYWGRRRVIWVVAFTAAATLPPALWCARNAAVFKAFEFSSMAGTNVYFWEAGAVLAAESPVPFQEIRIALEKSDIAAAPAGEGPFEASRRQRALARPILLSRPLIVLKLHAVALVKMLAGPGADLLAAVLWPGQPLPPGNPNPHKLEGSGTRAILAQRPLLWPAVVFTLLLLGATYSLSAWGLWALEPGRRTEAAVFFLLPAAYLAAISSWSFAYYRFRLPMIPLLAAVAAGALLARRRA